MLIDKVEVTFRGGDGGNGKVSFVKIGRGPDGGNGGKGGDLYLKSSSDLTLLNQFSRETLVAAQNGEHGGRNKRSGKNGEDLEIILPLGTSIVSKDTGEILFELNKLGQRELLCRGGKGGRGNWEFRSSRMTTPKFAEDGKKGQEKKIVLNLKLIADFGLVGLPNTGKSSLLNELTNAKAQTANYHFTTLSPNLGIFEKKVISDVPGLIEGASHGKGLGIGFLKHVEKVKVLIHCISAESVDPVHDYEVIRKEMTEFNPELLDKVELVVLTKTDLVDKKEIAKVVKNLKKKSKNILPISIYDPESISELKDKLRAKI